MKRIFCFLLSVIMITTLVGCDSVSTTGKPKPNLDNLIAMRKTTLRHQSITYWDPDYYIYDVNYNASTASFSEESYRCKGTFDIEFNEWFRIEGELTSSWHYYDSDKSWHFMIDWIDDINCFLNTNIEGGWKKYRDKEYIFVKNQTETGFDVFVEKLDYFGTLKDEWIHVERWPLSDDELKELINDGGCRVKYYGKNSAGGDVNVTLFTQIATGSFGIEVKAEDGQGRGYDAKGYYSDYVPQLVKTP